MVSRICWNPVDRSNISFHVDGSRTRSRRITVAGSQWRLLYREQAKGSSQSTSDATLVPLGSGHDVAEWTDPPYHCLLSWWLDEHARFRRRAHQHRSLLDPTRP